MVTVVIPYAPACADRAAALQWVLARYAEQHPSFDVVVAETAAGAWSKAAAVVPAIDAAPDDVIVVADADSWTDGLAAAIDQVAAGAPWAIPHTLVHRLNAPATAAVLAGAPWRTVPLVEQPYQGVHGGGFVIASRDTLRRIPLDPRFIGWGGEDEAWAASLTALAGAPWRGAADLVHLFHQPPARQTRRRGSAANWRLRCRYLRAVRDPAEVEALIAEGASVCLSPA